MVKNPPAYAGDARDVGLKRCRFDPWAEKIPWNGKWQHIPVFLPGEFHGQRSLEGCRPWGHKESDMTEHTQRGVLKYKGNLEFPNSDI